MIRQRASLILSLLVVTLAAGCANAPPALVRVAASPQVVPGGGLVQVSARATDPNGDALKFAWTASAGWTLKSSGYGTAVVQAPAKTGATGLVTVTVSDGHGGTAKGSVGVATSDTAPVIAGLSATPTPAAAGEPVTLSANASDPDRDPVTYAWSIVAEPVGSTVALSSKTSATPTFTPDRVGTYAVGLVVTDAGGNPSAPASLQVEVVDPTPTATIAGTGPLAAVMNTDLVLDGSASTSPAGDALIYAWSVTGGPVGSNAKVTPVGTTGTANFFADTAGTYLVQLDVTDPFGATGTATTTVAVAGPAKLTIASGDAQTGQVHADLAKPLVVQATTSGGKPVPGLAVDWIPAGGTLETSATTTTDAHGDATTAVRTSRIAGTGRVVARLDGMPSLTQTFSFTATPGPATSIAVSMTTGNADTGATVSVRPVDAYGNPTTADKVADAEHFRLLANEHATFASTAIDGTLLAGGGTNRIDAAGSGGSFDIALHDKFAEPVTVTITATPKQGAYLPYSGWTEDFEDNAEAGMGAWTTASSTAPAWKVENGASTAHGGGRSFGLDLPASGNTVTGWSSLAYAATPPSTTMAKLSYWQQVTVASAHDATKDCTAQPDLVLAGSSCGGNGCVRRTLIPRGGYPVTDVCSGPVGFASTSGWEHRVADVTDALAGGYTDLGFYMSNTPDPSTPASPSSWHVDDVRLLHLTQPGDTGKTNTIIRPGAAAKVDWAASTFTDPPLFYQCPNTVPDITVAAQIVDANGNVTQDSQLALDFNWTPYAVAVRAATGTVVSLGASDAVIQFDQGHAALVLADTNPQSVDVSLTDPQGTKLTMGPDAAADFVTYVCHYDSLGGYWADGAPFRTYDKTEAIRACETHFYASHTTCVANSTSSYRPGRPISCPSASQEYQWVYTTTPYTDACTGAPGTLKQGNVYQTLWIDPSMAGSPACSRFCSTGVYAGWPRFSARLYYTWE